MSGFSAVDLRRMLSRLRDVMAGIGAVQERLDKVVALIAQDMRVDVCSCYVMRAGEVLEAARNAGLGIIDLTTEESDLEDIFLQLTRAPMDAEGAEQPSA